jgi:hypothetical protein
MALIRAIRADLGQMTFDDITGGSVPYAVTITGSRCTEHREPAEYGLLFDAYLRPFAGQGSTIYVKAAGMTSAPHRAR